MKRVALASLGIAACVGAAWNCTTTRHLAHLHPVPGRLVPVNGRPMHIYCSGSGSPTVVLETGLGWEWWQWQRVQPALSRVTRICSYDRAGLGASAAQSGPRDAIHIAWQLHGLLHAVGADSALVLVGQSAGGLYIRAYAGLYPAAVRGLVFVDAASPEMFSILPGARESAVQRAQRHRSALMAWLSVATGWARIVGRCRGTELDGLARYAIYNAVERCRPSAALDWLGEVDDFELSGREAAAAPCCGRLPILILSQDRDRPKPGWDAQSIAANPIWASLQEHLKQLSPRSWRIVARSAGHHVMVDRPDVVFRSIRDLVLVLRGAQPEPAYGTTTIE